MTLRSRIAAMSVTARPELSVVRQDVAEELLLSLIGLPLARRCGALA